MYIKTKSYKHVPKKLDVLQTLVVGGLAWYLFSMDQIP
jgi:hypothetical protein